MSATTADCKCHIYLFAVTCYDLGDTKADLQARSLKY